MTERVFRFQHFSVSHSISAMKVGTDGVLLGAWAQVAQAQHILDVGTGCGLIALMVAQRSHGTITGIDIDPGATTEAADNFAASPWATRLSASCISLQDYQSEAVPYLDTVVSNPPFFDTQTHSPHHTRALARHTDTLPYEDLVTHAARLLRPMGTLQVIVPMSAAAALLQLGHMVGMHPSAYTEVISKAGAKPIRTLLRLHKCPTPLPYTQDDLTLYDAHGDKTAAYQALVGTFYL